MENLLFTSESVGAGHPDKVCDAIADAVLDEIIGQDPTARVACEACCTTGVVFVMGEITTDCYVDIARVARKTIEDIGYNSSDMGFDHHTCSVLTCIDEQSPDISGGVSNSLETRVGGQADIGAGDQGMMFGFACDQTEELMPMPIALSHKLVRCLEEQRKGGALPFCWPDAKSQVTIEYEGGQVKRIDTVVMSTQHVPDVTQEQIRDELVSKVIMPTLPKALIDDKTRILINPSGRFVVGGPHGDSGLTGRKIIVDTYGGYARHGGGSFAGKDPTKVDRSATYMARYMAKNLVAAGVAKELELQLAYAIGVAHPVSVNANAFGTGIMSNEQIVELVKKTFDLRPAAIIDFLDLRKPIYRQTAAYGHFGRLDIDLPWERLNSVSEIKKGL